MQVGVSANAAGIEIMVKDNGAGIRVELVDRMSGSGSGLGVPHARETLGNFGGQVRIESEAGVGRS